MLADRKPAVPAVVTKLKALDMATKRSILRELSQGSKNCKLVKKYVSKSTISMILKKKIASSDADNRKCRRNATYADALLKWFVDARTRNISMSGPVMLGKAKKFAFLLDFPDFCPGNAGYITSKCGMGSFLNRLSVRRLQQATKTLPLGW